MNFTANELKTFLDALGTLGMIRVGELDATPDEICCIQEYGGQAASGRFGIAGIGYERPAVQIVFRGLPNDLDTPFTKARIAYLALAAVQPGTLYTGSTVYQKIVPQQPPFALPKDASSRRYTVVCNYYIDKEP